MPSPRELRKKQKKNLENTRASITLKIQEPLYLQHSYTTDELIFILKYAHHYHFPPMDAFRVSESSDDENDKLLAAMLDKILQDTSDESSENPADRHRISLSIKPKQMPYALAALIKTAIRKWVFTGEKDANLSKIINKFNQQLQEAYWQAHAIIAEKYYLGKRTFQNNVPQLLSSLNSFTNPAFFHKIENLIINLIMELTAQGYSKQAKAIHLFFMVCKKIIATCYADSNGLDRSEDREKVAPMLALPLIEGLKITLDKPAALDETSELISTLDSESTQEAQAAAQTDSEITSEPEEPITDDVNPEPKATQDTHATTSSADLIAFTACLFNIAVRHPLFDAPYNKKIYSIYHRLNQLCEKSGLFENHAMPDLLNRDLKAPLKEELFNKLEDICDKLWNQAEKHQAKATHRFFIKWIKKHYELQTQQSGKDIHNVIYLLGELYDKDETPEKNEHYAKVLRQLLQLPSQGEERDILFDKLVARVVFNGEYSQRFKKPFDEADYKMTPVEPETYRYIRALQYSLNQALKDIVTLSRANTDHLKAQEGYRDDAVRLEQKVSKLSAQVNDLKLASPDDRSLSPPSSPPKERNFLHRFRKLSSEKPEKPEALTLANRTKSSPALPKFRSSPS
ncbi:MAG: hypothetical protein JSR17_08520 [Proteobacteria bacterium]|nr:hypothetical protein [Pseudomonadota bacterium]